MNFDFFDAILGVKNPKAFEGELKEKIEEQTLYCIRSYGRTRWISLIEIAKFIVNEERIIVHHRKAVEYLYYHYGLMGEITKATSRLRKGKGVFDQRKHPIIAGHGRQGYKYADEKCSDLIETWEESFRAWDVRKDNWNAERKTALELIDVVLKKLEEPEKRKKLIEIKQKYKKAERKAKNDETESED